MAKRAIKLLPESEHKQALNFLADYSVDRNH
jgi:geranylgeranyl pyrophosphate synthase